MQNFSVLWGTNMFDCNPKEVVGFDEVLSSEPKKVVKFTEKVKEQTSKSVASNKHMFLEIGAQWCNRKEYICIAQAPNEQTLYQLARGYPAIQFTY